MHKTSKSLTIVNNTLSVIIQNNTDYSTDASINFIHDYKQLMPFDDIVVIISPKSIYHKYFSDSYIMSNYDPTIIDTIINRQELVRSCSTCGRCEGHALLVVDGEIIPKDQLINNIVKLFNCEKLLNITSLFNITLEQYRSLPNNIKILVDDIR